MPVLLFQCSDFPSFEQSCLSVRLGASVSVCALRACILVDLYQVLLWPQYFVSARSFESFHVVERLHEECFGSLETAHSVSVPWQQYVVVLLIRTCPVP